MEFTCTHMHTVTKSHGRTLSLSSIYQSPPPPLVHTLGTYRYMQSTFNVRRLSAAGQQAERSQLLAAISSGVLYPSGEQLMAVFTVRLVVRCVIRSSVHLVLLCCCKHSAPFNKYCNYYPAYHDLCTQP